MRSRTGCLTCRSRKLKCDEQKPRCSQCQKARRECRPSEGVVFRHQQNASMNKGPAAALPESSVDPDGSKSPLKGFYSYRNSFGDDNVWLEIPKTVVFVENSDPAAEELEAALVASNPTPSSSHSHDWEGDPAYRSPSMTSARRGLDALSTAATQSQIPFHSSTVAQHHPIALAHTELPAASPPMSAGHDARHNMPPPASPAASIASSNTNIHFLLNPPSSGSPPVDTGLPTPVDRGDSAYTTTASMASRVVGEPRPEANVETDHEIAFLLRHFSEGPGFWMDLFDLETYFASQVPVKALANPLLKYAACAYAAKQLGRVKGSKAPVGGNCSKQASMEVWPDAGKVDWYWYAAKYYEKAIHILMKELQHDTEGPPPLSTPEAFGQWQAVELCDDGEHARKRRRRFPNSRLSSAHSDEVLAATAILSVYEFLDAADPAWNRHLSGVKSLLDIAELGMLPLEPQNSPGGTAFPRPKRPGLSKTRKATFWNFARQDYLASFINECQTRLNTEDLVLWTDAGLRLDSRGLVRPSNTAATNYSDGDGVMKEDLISNALIWILSKIVNFITSGDKIHMGTSSAPLDSGPIGLSQATSLERWYRLRMELDTWYNGLPDTFRPCARINPPKPSCSSPSLSQQAADECPFPEVWYSMPMCSSTMQHYHMARILLLVNKPHESTVRSAAVTNRLKSFRSIESDVRYHSHEICGISMARPDGSVRIHSLQPLFVSGQCLTEPCERRTILRLLKGIEADTGWATEYRVKQLLKEWDWDEARVLGGP